MAKKTENDKKKDIKKHDKKTYMHWYESMLLMRRFEEKCGQLYTQQKFGGFCHLYIGQEAILAGMVSAMKKNDNVITAYRDHVHPIALGTDPKYIMAELYGKTTGTSKGKGGSMHMFDKERGLFGGHGIVGGQIGLGTGLAFADRYKKSGKVTYCFMGDGAVRQGILHETFNMAMMWNLPIVYIIENNFYAMGTAVSRSSNVHNLYEIGESYDMKAEPVDGMTCEDVYDAIDRAAEHARSGKGPYLLEVKTYRYKGHSMSDPAKYRTKQELESFKKEDPIEKVKDTILKEEYATEEDLKKIGKKVMQKVQECVEFAESSPDPEAKDLYESVYMQNDYPFLNHK